MRTGLSELGTRALALAACAAIGVSGGCESKGGGKTSPTRVDSAGETRSAAPSDPATAGYIASAEQAIRDGYLVDYDAVAINSDVKLNGVFLNEGEAIGRILGDIKIEQRGGGGNESQGEQPPSSKKKAPKGEPNADAGGSDQGAEEPADPEIDNLLR